MQNVDLYSTSRYKAFNALVTLVTGSCFLNFILLWLREVQSSL